MRVWRHSKAPPREKNGRQIASGFGSLTYRKKFRHSLTDEEQGPCSTGLRTLYPGLSHEPDDYGLRMMMSFGEKNLASGQRSEQTDGYYRQPKTG